MFKWFTHVPKLKKRKVVLKAHSGYQSDHTYEENMQDIAMANLDMQQEALQHTLNLMHKTMLIATLSLMVAIIAVAVAVIK